MVKKQPRKYNRQTGTRTTKNKSQPKKQRTEAAKSKLHREKPTTTKQKQNPKTAVALRASTQQYAS